MSHLSLSALPFETSHNTTAASPIAAPITPPTASILATPLLLVDVAEVLAPVAVEELDDEEVAAADELLAGMACTSEGWRVPQVLQA